MKKALEAMMEHIRNKFTSDIHYQISVQDMLYILNAGIAALSEPEPADAALTERCCSVYPNCIHQLQNIYCIRDEPEPAPTGDGVDWEAKFDGLFNPETLHLRAGKFYFQDEKKAIK